MPYADRFLTVPPPVELGGRHIKRYEVNVAERPVDAAVREAAYAFLPQLLAEPDSTPPVAVSVLHQGAEGAYLDVFSWVWDNVLECHNAAAGVPFLGCADTDLTHFSPLLKPWIGCVWELAALAHEPSAWVRHMLEPEVADLAGYLGDTVPAGPVGAGSRAAASAR